MGRASADPLQTSFARDWTLAELPRLPVQRATRASTFKFPYAAYCFVTNMDFVNRSDFLQVLPS